MRDAGTSLRKSFFEALDNQIFVEGAAIPVVDEKLDEQITEQDIYIALTTQTDNDRSNKSYFAHEIDIATLIVQRTKAAISKATIEYVNDRILQIILPSVGNHGLTIDAPFRVTYVKQVSGQTQTARLDNGDYVIAKQTNFRNRITQ